MSTLNLNLNQFEVDALISLLALCEHPIDDDRRDRELVFDFLHTRLCHGTVLHNLHDRIQLALRSRIP